MIILLGIKTIKQQDKCLFPSPVEGLGCTQLRVTRVKEVFMRTAPCSTHAQTDAVRVPRDRYHTPLGFLRPFFFSSLSSPPPPPPPPPIIYTQSCLLFVCLVVQGLLFVSLSSCWSFQSVCSSSYSTLFLLHCFVLLFVFVLLFSSTFSPLSQVIFPFTRVSVLLTFFLPLLLFVCLFVCLLLVVVFV